MPFSCFLFRPRKSREKRRKRSHTNVSSTLSTRSSTPPAQTPHVCFQSRKRVHTRFRQQDRTQRLTCRSRGLPSLGHSAVLCCLRNRHRKNQLEKVDARQWRVSAFSGTAPPLGCGNLFFCYSVAIFAPLPVCQQLEFSIKTIRRPNVHCKTECILLQYSEKPLEWRRYTICPLSLFARTSRK